MAIKIKIGKKKPSCGCSEAKKRGFAQGKPPKGEIYKKQDIYLEEKDENLLHELTEDEFERAKAAVGEIDPDDLAFNQIFGDKKRLVIDFPVADRDTDAGRFINIWSDMPDVGTGGNYSVDWEKGLVSGIRTLEDTGNKAQRQQIDQMMFGGEKRKGPKQKKVQMKIGKWFAKVHDLASKRQEIIQLFWKKFYEQHFKGERPYEGGQTNFSGQPTGKIEELIGEEKYDRYDQLTDQLKMYTGLRGMTSYGQFPDKAVRDGKYWQENAAFIKQNMNKISTDKYAIIITRDPIDEFRMSDFDQISSCHSPPSRPSPAGNSYYKCAVAEASGHGAVAYVVSMSKLLAVAGAETLQKAEDNIQEGELFADDVRGSHIGYAEDFVPLSRIRIRQYRYYVSPARAVDAADRAKPSIEGSVQLAVPESGHIPYGLQVPGFMDRLEDWAREHQQEAMAGVPRSKNGELQSGAFVLYGGSYEESNTSGGDGRRRMLANFFEVSDAWVKGRPQQDTSTERKLPKDIGYGIIEWTETAVAGTVMEWNQRWYNQTPKATPDHPAMYASARVEDHDEDEAGIREFSIHGDAVMRIFWDPNEWKSLPNFDETNWIDDEMKDYGFGFVKNLVVIKRGNVIYAKFDINNEGIYNVYSSGLPYSIDLKHTAVTYSPEGFELYCLELNKIDDVREAIKATLARIFKREGWLAGGAFTQLARDIENQEISSYKWDLESDDEYEDAYEAHASLSYDFDPEALGMDPRALFKILDSRPFRLLVRQGLLKEPRETVGTEYWLDVADSSAVDVGGNIRYTIQFRVTADHPDEQVELFRTLVTEMDDEDEIATIMNQVIKNVQNARNPAVAQDLDENKKYDASWAVQTWKLGL